MSLSNSELHLRRARELDDPASAIAEYMRAIEHAVEELKQVRVPQRIARRR